MAIRSPDTTWIVALPVETAVATPPWSTETTAASPLDHATASVNGLPY